MVEKTTSTDSTVFPSAEVKARLRRELGKAAAEGQVLRADWEPLLESIRVAAIVPKLEEIFGFRLPPDKIVRKGGYISVDDGVGDMHERLQRLWQKNEEKRRSHE